MRYVTAALRWFLFLVFFLFALKNHELVSLRFYFDLEWKLPLVLLLFVFFLAGAVIGLLALLPRVMRQRREVNAVLGELKALRGQGAIMPAAVGSRSSGGAAAEGAALTHAPRDAVAAGNP